MLLGRSLRLLLHLASDEKDVPRQTTLKRVLWTDSTVRHLLVLMPALLLLLLVVHVSVKRLWYLAEESCRVLASVYRVSDAKS